MSDFWSRKLGQQAPPPPQPSAPASARPWWDNSQQVNPQAMPQAQLVYDQQGNAFVVGPNGQLMAVQQQDNYTTDKAPSARQTQHCPSCGSRDYAVIGRAIGPSGSFDAMRCFDCGYPVQQEFSGMAIVSSAPVAGKARQIAHDGGGITSNYQPQNTAAGRV